MYLVCLRGVCVDGDPGSRVDAEVSESGRDLPDPGVDLVVAEVLVLGEGEAERVDE